MIDKLLYFICIDNLLKGFRMELNDTTVECLVHTCNAISRACGDEKHTPLMAGAIQECRDALKIFADDRIPSVNHKVHRLRPCKFNKNVRGEMRRLHASGVTQKELAKMMNTTQAYVSILLRK